MRYYPDSLPSFKIRIYRWYHEAFFCNRATTVEFAINGIDYYYGKWIFGRFYVKGGGQLS